MGPEKKTVAIIGGGVSGLVAIKCCVEEGIEPVCFEQRDEVGGLWNLDKEKTEGMTDIGARIYSACVLNADKSVFCFSDFPLPKDANLYPQAREALPYINSYADHFGLKTYIRLSTKVTKLEKSSYHNETGRWRITSQQLGHDPVQSSEEYDFVIVCIGMYNRPRYPDIPSLDEFQGTKMHAGSYFEPYIFKNKTVLVYGGGITGPDVSVDLAREAKKVYLSSRRGFWVLPRMVNDVPITHITLNKYANETRPLSAIHRNMSTFLRSRTPLREFSMEPQGRFMESGVALTDGLDHKIISGQVSVMPDIQCFGKGHVKFQNGKSVEIDAVLFATGYMSTCSFLDGLDFPFPDKSIPYAQLFLGIFPHILQHCTLAFVGKMDPYGPMPPTFELQARVVARVLSGRLPLPSRDQMKKEATADYQRRTKRWGTNIAREVLYCYQKQLSSFLGAYPSLKRLFRMFFYDPVLAWKVLMGPSIPPVYRLFGPHAKWGLARESIVNVRDHLFNTTRTINYTEKGSSFRYIYLGLLIMAMLVLVFGMVIERYA